MSNELKLYSEEEIRELPAILDTKQVARIVGITPQRTSRNTARGKLPAIKIGGEWKYSKRKILELFSLESLMN